MKQIKNCNKDVYKIIYSKRMNQNIKVYTFKDCKKCKIKNCEGKQLLKDNKYLMNLFNK